MPVDLPEQLIEQDGFAHSPEPAEDPTTVAFAELFRPSAQHGEGSKDVLSTGEEWRATPCAGAIGVQQRIDSKTLSVRIRKVFIRSYRVFILFPSRRRHGFRS